MFGVGPPAWKPLEQGVYQTRFANAVWAGQNDDIRQATKRTLTGSDGLRRKPQWSESLNSRTKSMSFLSDR